MSQLVWTPAAKSDIQKHYDYLYPRNADSADKAVKLIDFGSWQEPCAIT